MYQTDMTAAGRTLARLIDYMSAARAHMERQEAVLGDELALTEGYLEIQRLRMGARLRYEIEVSPELHGNRIPPAALLTLIAERHQARAFAAPRRRPAAGGGASRRRLDRVERVRQWRRLPGDQRARLVPRESARSQTGLYGGEASLRLTGAEEGGVMATMRLPFGPPPAGAVA